jgi:hypothetical protein
MSTWADDYLQLIEDCEHRESRLTDWERTFIDDLRRSIELGNRPTKGPNGQAEKLDEIWERATAKG